MLSQSLNEEEDGIRLGADDYSATANPTTFEQLAGRFDLIVNTVSANLDLDAYVRLLETDGTLVQVGVPSVRLESAVPADHRAPSLAGSMIGGIAETQEMLDFCAEHGVRPTSRSSRSETSTRPTSACSPSDVRYRFVIDTVSLRYDQLRRTSRRHRRQPGASP